jgi:uncharacterized protein (TIGR00299 family) protein
MPVPAPATAKLLQGMPLTKAPIESELVTPTGAAILATLVNEFTDQPEMTIERIGCGAGKKDFWEQPNILRVFIGTSAATNGESDIVQVLETNLDDVSPEVIGYCVDRLFAAGALDVYTVPIHMKKNRPGVILSVMSPQDCVESLETIIFRETGTFGIRRFPATRSKLHREMISVATPWGAVKAKKGWRGDLTIVTPEYEDCARVARENGVTLRAVFDAVERGHPIA